MDTITLNGLIYNKYRNQSDMAEKMGWSRQRLNKIINGKKVPDLMEVDCLATALGVDLMTVAQFFLPEKSPYGDPIEFLLK